MSNNPNSASPTSKNSEITPEDFEKLVDGADEEVSQQMGAATLNLATGEKPKILAYQYDKVLETMKALVDDFSKTSFFGKEKNLTKTVAELKGIISKTVNDILSSAVHEDDKITDDEIEVILQKLEEDGFIGANKGKYTFAGKDDFYQLYKSYKIDQSNTKRSPAPASVADSVKIAMSNDPEITAKVIASMLSGVGNNNGNGEQNQQDSQNPSELPQDPSVTQWIIPPTPPSSNNVVPPATVLPPAPNSDNHTENGGDQLNEAEKSQLKDAIGKAAVSFLRNIFEGKSTSVSEIKIGNLTVSEAKAKLGDEWDNDTEFFKKAGLLELSNEAIEKLKNFFKDIHFSDEENAKLDASEGLIDKENYTNNADSLIHDLTTGDGYARIIGPNGKKLRMRIVATKNGETNVNVPENLGEFQGRLGEVNKDNPQRFAANKMSNFIKYGALISRNNSESMDYLGNFRKELDGRLSTEKIEAGETQFRIYENDTPTGDTWNYFAANKIIPEAGNLEARAAASETDEGYAINIWGKNDLYEKKEQWVSTSELNYRYIISYLNDGVSKDTENIEEFTLEVSEDHLKVGSEKYEKNSAVIEDITKTAKILANDEPKIEWSDGLYIGLLRNIDKITPYIEYIDPSIKQEIEKFARTSAEKLLDNEEDIARRSFDLDLLIKRMGEYYSKILTQNPLSVYVNKKDGAKPVSDKDNSKEDNKDNTDQAQEDVAENENESDEKESLEQSDTNKDKPEFDKLTDNSTDKEKQAFIDKYINNVAEKIVNSDSFLKKWINLGELNIKLLFSMVTFIDDLPFDDKTQGIVIDFARGEAKKHVNSKSGRILDSNITKIIEGIKNYYASL